MTAGTKPTFVILAAMLTLIAGLHPSRGNAATAQQWNFRVLLDDRDIGYHRFELRPSATGFQMLTRAEFEVRFLRLKAFDYQHRNLETWRNGCLAAISTRTESNGERFQVDGQRNGEQFTVATQAGRTSWQECIGSFAYWDRSLLQRDRLLNPQTGELLAVRLEPLAPTRLTIGDLAVDVNRYRLTGKDLDITVAYTVAGDQWVALDSVLEGGRSLRYRRVPTEVPTRSDKGAASIPMDEDAS